MSSLLPFMSSLLDGLGRLMGDASGNQAVPPAAEKLSQAERSRRHKARRVAIGLGQVNVRVPKSDKKEVQRLARTLRSNPGARISAMAESQTESEQAEEDLRQVSVWVPESGADEVYRLAKVLRDNPGTRITQMVRAQAAENDVKT